MRDVEVAVVAADVDAAVAGGDADVVSFINQYQAVDCFDKIIKLDEPNRTAIANIIDEILIYHDKSVKFELRADIKELIS